ncbi:MAG: lipase maturation factor family protein, partial [Gemmatimonadota bacterium]
MPLYEAHEHQLVRFLFLRGLALVYLVAFLVTANQWRGLVGEDGLLPAPDFLRRAELREAPSLFHWRYSDRLAEALAWVGAALAAATFLGLPSAIAGTAGAVLAWLALWALYLSFVNVGQVFYAFGWESQLLETGFLAVFLGGAGTEAPEVVVFRVMLGAGLIKIRGDRCWRELTCLHYHHETQPLPNPLSWFFHHLPSPVLKGGVALTHAVQLVVPFAFFAPAPIRWWAG